MKRTVFQCLALFVVILSCEKNDDNTNYTINFTLSKSEVITGDTVTLFMEWNNSAIDENIQVSAYKMNSSLNPISVPILGLNQDNNLIIKIPAGLESNSEIQIIHSNGASARQFIYKKYFPIVKEVTPKKGKGGDIITIKGAEFLSGYDIKVGINTMLCEIVETSDSVLICEVPVGCGSGRIKIYCWENELMYPSLEINFGIFDYQWPNQDINKKVISYSIDGKYWDLERDNNVVTKRTLRYLAQMNGNDSYIDYFSYGLDGLVDTIFHSTDNRYESYSTIKRSSDNTIILITKYSYDNTVETMRDIYFHNGLISNIDYYTPSIQSVKTASDQYRFNSDTLTIKRTYFDENGAVVSSDDRAVIVDNLNGEFPDLGIPGYHHMFDYLFLNIDYTYPTISSRYGTSYIQYNESGNLVEWKNMTDYGSSGPYTIVSFQYE